MKKRIYFKPLAYSMLALGVSLLAISASQASPYSNNGYDGGEVEIRTEYTGTSNTMGFFDKKDPKYAGEITTRIQQRREALQPIDVRQGKNFSGKTYRDGSIFGGTCCEATEGQDNSIFPGQGCGKDGLGCDKNVAVKASPCTVNPQGCKKAAKAPKVAKVKEVTRYNFVQNYTIKPSKSVYDQIHGKCGFYAPIQLEWVDFKLNGENINGPLMQKLGNYRFRIFGCRRFTKEAVLNQGRLMENNLKLISIFDNELKDCFNIVKIPDDICTEETPSPLPEYLITADITNFFMNICDKYNWNEGIPEDRRIGSSEITVRWTVTDNNRTQVYWSGETDGYGDLLQGEQNGEVLLVEKAFADAVNNLRNHPAFLKTVSHRLTPAEKESDRNLYIEHEKAYNPIKCQYTNHEAKENSVTKYVYTPEDEPIVKQSVKTTTTTQTQSIGSTPQSNRTTTTTTTTTTVTRTDPVIPLQGTSQATTPTAPIPAPLTTTPTPEIATKTQAPTPEVATKVQTTAPAPQEQATVLKGLELEETETVTETVTEEVNTQPADILLNKEAAPEPLDPSMNPMPTENRYSKEPSEGEGISPLLAVVGAPVAAVAAPIAALTSDQTPMTPCNNMTLFGPDCDCNNKIYGGCEDNKLYGGCEDNKLNEPCDKCDSIFNTCCDTEEEMCKIPVTVEEDGGVKATGSLSKETWINIPLDDKNAIEAQNSLCIIERAPYGIPLSAEDVYKVRMSIISITNVNGKEGAGLIVSDQFVLTSADLITKEQNSYTLRTINGGQLTGHAVRINPKKNTALIYLDQKTMYTPLSLNLSLPPINQKTYMSLGILDFDTGEGYLEDSGKIKGYRYSEDRGTEILLDTYVQNITLGGALIDKDGTVTGLAHSGNSPENTDLFLPIATALKSVGLEICGKQITDIPVKNSTISEAILFNEGSKEPLPMDKAERK